MLFLRLFAFFLCQGSLLLGKPSCVWSHPKGVRIEARLFRAVGAISEILSKSEVDTLTPMQLSFNGPVVIIDGI